MILKFFLGMMYDMGLSTEKNPEEAARWLLKAAEHGHEPAQYAIGIKYATGHGVEQNNAEATRWLSKAEKNGYKAARIFIEQLPKSTPSK